MSKAAMNLQDSFLNQVRRENSEVRVLLVNGTLLRGTVKGFDNFTLILNNRNGQHLIYKHAVAQIVTHRPYNKNEEFPSMDSEDISSDSASEKPSKSEERTATAPASPKHDLQTKHENNPKHGKDAKPGADNEENASEEKAPAKSKPRKEGFNKLDLSHLKLGKADK